MNKIAVTALAAVLLGISPALALNDTIGVTAGSGKTANLISFASGHVINEVGICDATAENQCAVVSAGGAVKVDNSGVTQPVSAVSLPLPTGAATSANQTNASQKTQVVDGSGNVVASTSNALNVSAIQSGTWNVTNISGTVSLPTGAATSANQPTAAAQASTTSGQTGPLVQCAVTTSAPTYTTAQTDPLSCDTSGNLRIVGTISTGSLATSANQTNASQKSQIVDGSGNVIASTSNALNVNVNNANPNGQAVPGSSSPVVIASHQICGTATTVHVSTNTDTQILAASGSQTVYICDYDFQLTGVGSFYFEKSSTGTCASPTQIGPLWTGLSGTPIGKAAGNAFYRGFNTGASQQLCVHTASLSSTTLDVTVYTDQY